MTEVIYNERELSLEFKGHAGNALLCAGLSTLWGAIRGMVQVAPTMMGEAEIEEEKDRSYIRCKPRPQYLYNVVSVMRTVFVGAAVLADNYPDNIQVREDNGDAFSDR